MLATLATNSSSLSPQQAAQELLNRRLAQRHLARFIEYLDVGYIPARHHLILIEALEAVERGELQRLMVLMPPGSAKSTYASVLFPPWFMGRHPQDAVLAVSNTKELAERFSRRARNLVGLDAYRNVFGFGLNEDMAAAGNWENSDGGEFFAAGVGGTVTGRRADLGLIDDPVKSRQEADSEIVRQTQWDWYVNDFLTRLKPRARQILIQTRWHEDDLGGRILAREAAQWKVIKLPMIAGTDDPLGRAIGERLWPEWFTEDQIATAKLDPRGWNALYQQDPVPDEGDYFKREDFGEYITPPQNLKIYGASDYAVTEGGGDFSEHGIAGMDWNGDMYVLDWWFGQTKSDIWIERQCDMIVQWQPLTWFGEAGPIKKAIEPYLKKRMDERQAYCRLEWLPSVVDKVTRARPIQGRAAMGKVHFPKHAQWKEHVFSALMRFPTAKVDDPVDVMSLFGRGLEFMTSPKIKKPQGHVPPPPAQSQGWMGV